jgi:hypothetical protein
VANSVTFTATAADNTGVTSVTFLVDGVSVGSDSSAPYSLSWDSRTVANGSRIIQARAVDGNTNQATSTGVTVTVQNTTPDTTAPSVSVTAPAASATVANVVTLTASASDNVGVSSVTFLVDGTVVGSDSSSPYSFSWDSTSVANGARVIRARAVDAAGNTTNSANVTVTVQNTVDTTGPSVNLSQPSTGVVLSGTVVLAANAADNAGGSGVASVAFLVNNQVVGSDPTSPYTFSWNSGNVQNGPYTIQARAVDVAGNQVTSGGVSVIVENAAPVSGLVAHWKFDETTGAMAGDASGNNNNATLMNGVTHVPSPNGNAAAVNGVNAYAAVPNAPNLEPTNALSVSVWAKLQSNGGWQTLVGKVTQDGAHAYPYTAYEIFVEDRDGSFIPRLGLSGTDGNRVYADGNRALTYGQWYHIAGTYDGSTLKIYINGALESTSNYSAPLLRTGQPLYIGRNGSGGDALKGQVDELRIYNRALTISEVGTLARPSAPKNLRVEAP